MRPIRRLSLLPSLSLLACAASTAAAQTAAARAPAPVAAAPTLDAAALARVDSLARAVLAGGRVPSASIAVAVGDRIVLARGYGQANREVALASGPEVMYRVGSVTKQFTAALILRLAEQGKLRLDDPITRFLPDYPTQGHTVTVRHLLNHTSGIRSYTGVAAWRPHMGETVTQERLLSFFQNEPFDFAPGTAFRYNNSGYFLLGMIVERVTGRPYAEYLRETLLRPLGLRHTDYCPDRPAAGQAEGYSFGAGGLAPARSISMTHPYAAGALCSTPADLVRWTRALVAGRVVSPASYRAMTTPDTLNDGKKQNYGYGLGVGSLEGHRVIDHGGGIPGFSAQLAYYPDRDLTVAVLLNSDAYDAERVAQNVARVALGLPLPTLKNLPLTAEERARYVGTYDLGPMQLRVYVEGDRLMVQPSGQPVSPLLYQGEHEFRPGIDERIRLVFQVNGDRAQGLVLHQGGSSRPAPRIE